MPETEANRASTKHRTSSNTKKIYKSTIQVVLLEYFSNNTWTLATTLKVGPLDKMREIDKERRLQERGGDEEK